MEVAGGLAGGDAAPATMFTSLDRRRNVEASCARAGVALTTVPAGFALHKTVERQLEAKRQMFASGEGFDWATAEALAFGTLLRSQEGLDVNAEATKLQSELQAIFDE